MGWRDDPIVGGIIGDEPQSWQQDPIVSEAAEAPQPYVPIPDIIPPQPEPRPQRPDHLRPGWEMTGATAGAALGAWAGPGGMLAGGALGSMAGSGLYDLTQDMAEWLGLTSPDTRSPDVAERLQKMGAAGRGDFMFGGAGQMMGPFLQRAGKGVKSWALGLNRPGMREATDLAHGQGIHIGPIHLSPRKWARGYSRVIGVFPIVGTPMRTGQLRVVGDIDARAADLLNTLAPRTSMDIGEEMTKSAEYNYKRFRAIGGALYDNFADLANNLSVLDVIPTKALKAEMAGYAARAVRETPVLQSGARMQPPSGGDPLGDWLRQIDELPEHITVEQARGLQRTLNQMSRENIKSADDFARMTGMRDAVRQSINGIDVSRLPPAEAENVTKALRVANQFWAENAATFQTATAKRFGRVNTNMFEPGFFKAGSLDRDEVFKAVFRSGSVDAISDLRKLVGGRVYNKAVRSYMETAFRNATIPAKEGGSVGDLFSAQKLEKILGIDSENGRRVLNAMLSHTSLSPDTLNRFLKAAKTATDVTIRDPSSFVMRRVTLGGAAAIGGALLLGAGKITIPKALILTYFARQVSKGLMDPDTLRRLTRAIGDNATEQQKRALLMRMVEGWEQDPYPEGPAPPTD